MAVVAESYVDLLQSPSSFDVDEVLIIDEDVRDGVVLQQRLERSQSKDLVNQVGLQLILLDGAKRHFLFRHNVLDQQRDRLHGFSIVDGGQFFQIHLRQQSTM